MPSQRVPADVAESLFSGAASVADPGDGGKISFNLKGYAHCQISFGAGAESRTLETPTLTNYPVGQLLSVYVISAGGGNVTISGSGDITSTTLAAAGDFVIYQLIATGAATRAWRTIFISPLETAQIRSLLTGKAVNTPTITANAATLTGAQVLGGTVILNNANTAANITWPTAASLAGSFPGGAAVTGDAVDVVVTGIGGTAVFTFLTNTGVTLTGTSPALTASAAGVSRVFRLTFTSASAYTVS